MDRFLFATKNNATIPSHFHMSHIMDRCENSQVFNDFPENIDFFRTAQISSFSQSTYNRFEIAELFWIHDIFHVIRLYNNKFSNRNSNNNIQAERALYGVGGDRHFKSAAETFWTGVERMELPMARLSSMRVYEY